MSGNLSSAADLMSILTRVEKLIEENNILEKKEEKLAKKRRENVSKICKLLNESKKLSDGVTSGAAAELSYKRLDMGSNDTNNLNQEEMPIIIQDGHQRVAYFNDLKSSKNKLLEEIKKSACNLKDHHVVLDTIEKEESRYSESWKTMYSKVKDYTRIHKLFKESRMKRISEIDIQLDQMVEENPTSDRHNLNESVLDCGKIVQKIPMKEIAAITPRELKVEDASPEASFSCNFEYCSKSFTCASTLASHLQNHYAQNEIMIDCPFVGCGFSNTRESLTSHMRAKHTGEKLFSCEMCPMKFHTMVAKVSHEKKHSRPDVWAQCGRQSCRKFYQIAKGSCRGCGRK